MGWRPRHDRIAFKGERFEFARHRSEAETVNAYVPPLLDEPADILAFRPDGTAATWGGRATMAGEEQVLFLRDAEPLDAHADV